MSRPRPTTHQLVLRYITERRVEGLEERTLAQWRGKLRDFAGAAPTDPRSITRRTVVRWLDRPGLSPAYQRTRLSVLRGFCRWCVVQRHMRRDPTAELALPRVAESIPRRLTTDEARTLVDVARGDRRLLLVVLLELQLGLRRLEVARLNVEDVDWTARTLTIRGKGHQGRASAVLPVDDETWSALRRYVDEEGHRNGPLVRNRVRAHGRMAPSTIGELVRAAMVDAGVKQPGDSTRTPHSLRHTMGSEVLERTGNLRLAQQALRHSSVHSTEVYVRGVVGGDLRQAMAGRRYT